MRVHNHEIQREVIVYKARDIAYEAILYAIENKLSLYNRHIQAILYISQVDWLVKRGHPCFKDEIERWKLGAVVRDVYQTLMVFNSYPIQWIPFEWAERNSSVPKSMNKGEIPQIVLVEDRKWIHRITQLVGNWSREESIMFFQQQELWSKYREAIWNNKGEVPFYKLEELVEYYSVHEREWV